MSQFNSNLLTPSARSTQSTTGPALPPREIPSSQVYRLPTQATPNTPSPFYAIRAGAMIGIFSDWDSVQWTVKSVAITNALRPRWRKCTIWNQAIHYINTGDYIIDAEILAGPLADPPVVRLQPEQIMADIFLHGTILLAQPGSIICPYTGTVGEPPAVQIIISRFSQVDSVWSNPPLNHIPLRNNNTELLGLLLPSNQTYDPIEPLLPPPSAPSSPVPTLISTTTAEYDVFMAPSLSGSSTSASESSITSRVARWASGPIPGSDTTPTSRRSESSARSRRGVRSQPPTPTTRLRLQSIGANSPGPAPFPVVVTVSSETQLRLQVVRAMHRQQPNIERQIEGSLIVELLLTGGFSRSWLNSLGEIINTLIESNSAATGASDASTSSSASGSGARF